MQPTQQQPPFQANPQHQQPAPGQHPQQGYPQQPGQFPYPQPGQPQPGQAGQWQPQPAASSQLPMIAGVAGVVLLALGMAIPFDSSAAWATQLAWSIFAIVAALLAVAGSMFRGSNPRTPWMVTAAGGVAVVAHWVFVVLPGISTNQGLVMTLGAAAVAAGVWFSPLRPR
ncbi:hypothetical protein GIS00_14750 [Nakamurella sp. YIM 132087]|uniref:Uncharacterized protein n=1 Tax=Nakamurella alba TaxID=2665158 RepID=A0A7K1FMA7_9ACTN|nr:hypothetical protein [Nakamurella alba]MTD15200.1 hypothetical protein [Nakamurella alba]